MNSVINVVSTAETQDKRPGSAEPGYVIYASNLKRSTAPGRVLGSVDLHILSLDLHLHCPWLRDERGNERLGMPRSRVELPTGRTHLKTLARWGTAQSEDRFQRAGLKALHELIAATEGDRLSAKPRYLPRSGPVPSLTGSGSSTPNAHRQPQP
jgi:hypothetical protein